MKNLNVLPITLRFFAWMMLLLALSSLAYTYTNGYILNKPYPYGFPVYGGLPAFTDFTDFRERYSKFGSKEFWNYSLPLIYPAPLLVVISLYYSVSNPLLFFITTSVSSVFASGLIFWYKLSQELEKKLSSIILVIIYFSTCFPIVFGIMRGNFEIVVSIAFSIGVVSLAYNYLYLAAIFIGIAGSMKYYPLILLASLLSSKNYKEFMVGLFTFTFLTLISLFIIDPSLSHSLRNIVAGLTFFEKNYFSSNLWFDFDHSLFSIIKIFIIESLKQNSAAFSFISIATKIYLGLTAVGGIILFFKFIAKKNRLVQIILLSVCGVLLPPVSYDYTLINLTAPCALLMIASVQQKESKIYDTPLLLSFFCFSLIFTWGSFLNLEGHRYAGQARAISMVLLLVIGFFLPLPNLANKDTSNSKFKNNILDN